jgi:hypothetical protein
MERQSPVQYNIFTENILTVLPDTIYYNTSPVSYFNCYSTIDIKKPLKTCHILAIICNQNV